MNKLGEVIKRERAEWRRLTLPQSAEPMIWLQSNAAVNDHKFDDFAVGQSPEYDWMVAAFGHPSEIMERIEIEWANEQKEAEEELIDNYFDRQFMESLDRNRA